MTPPPLRVAFFVGRFPQISETFVIDQITGLIDRGHLVDIYAREEGAPTPWHAVVDQYDLLSRTYYRRMPAHWGRRAAAALKLLATRYRKHPMVAARALNPLRHGAEGLCLSQLFWHARFLDRPSYDIVHCHFGPNGRLASRIREAGLLRGALVTTFHGYDLTQTLARQGATYYRQLFRTGDLFMPVSEYLKRKLLAAGCPEERIAVHHMGIDCDAFPVHAWTTRSDHPIQLLTIGRLVEKKGIEYGIRAVAAIAKDSPRVHYRIIGDGPLHDELTALITQLGVADRVELLGWQDRRSTIDQLRHAELLLAPSVTAADGNQEGIPVVLMEAMASGIPVVSTRHSGIPELVEEGRSGVLVPERDVDALAGALRRLLQDRSRWPEMGRHGRQTVAARFCRQRLDDQRVDAYRRIARRSTRQPATAAPKRL